MHDWLIEQKNDKEIEFYQAKQFLFETKTPLNDDSVRDFVHTHLYSIHWR